MRFLVCLLALTFAACVADVRGQESRQSLSERTVVAVNADGPVEDFIDIDAMLSPPPTPQPSSAGAEGASGADRVAMLGQTRPVQWLHSLLHAPAAALDGGIIDELLMVDEPLSPGIWPAPDGMQFTGPPDDGGGWLGIRGALAVAAQGKTQVLPNGLVFRPYLAGPKESRFSSQVVYEQDDGWLFDNTLGTRMGLIRWGNNDPVFPQGVQIDVEGSAQLRLDIPNDIDLRSADYRAGIPLTFGYGRHRTKVAYYHLSSHLGDEFLLNNQVQRLNYARDVILFAHAIYLSPALRVYAEAGWAVYTDVSEPWEFQFGADYAPARGTGPQGAPFFAVNGILREELNFGGGLTAQAGWSWRSHDTGRLLRVGAHYYNGAPTQYSFLGVHEQMIGFGVWLDN